MIFLEHPIQKQQTTHSSQVHRDHLPGTTTCWAIRWAVVNIKNWYHIKHLFWSQCYEIRINLQYKSIKKYSNMWQLNNMLLNNQWITKKIKDKIKSYLGTNENESTMVQNLWDQLQAVLRGKFIEILTQKIR